MQRIFRPVRFRELAALAAFLAACGGQSVRHVGGGGDDGAGAEGNAPASGRGGGSDGGTSPGGTTGAGPSVGGTGTSGTTTGGFAGTTATGGFGGTTSTGGSGIGAAGFGAVAGQCSGEPMPGLPPPSAAIRWDDTGRIDWAGSAFGIQGNWYSYDDCNAALAYNLPCTQRNPSLIAFDGQAGWATSQLEVCARGVAARVGLGPDGLPAWSIQWGFGLGFSLDDGLPYDATFRCVDGFGFDFYGQAPSSIRAQLTTTTTEDNPYFVTVPIQSFGVDFYFSDFQQGSWVTNPQPLDVTKLTNLQFFVYTSDQSTTPFDFCIKEVRVLHHTVAK